MTPLEPASASCDADSITMAPFHSLGQDDQNDMQHDYSGHVMPLALLSHYTDSVINDISVFLRSLQSKLGAI